MPGARRIAFAARAVAVLTLGALAGSPVGEPAAVASPAAAEVAIGVEDDFFAPRSTRTDVGTLVAWIWDLDGSTGGSTAAPHDVVARDDLFRSALARSGRFELRAPAGRFRFSCTIHFGMSGSLAVRPLADRTRPRGPILVRWAPRGADPRNRYDVRFRVDQGRWQSWREDERQRSAAFGLDGDPVRLFAERRYAIRVRTQRGDAERRRSGWSPTLTIGG